MSHCIKRSQVSNRVPLSHEYAPHLHPYFIFLTCDLPALNWPKGAPKAYDNQLRKSVQGYLKRMRIIHY